MIQEVEEELESKTNRPVSRALGERIPIPERRPLRLIMAGLMKEEGSSKLSERHHAVVFCSFLSRKCI